MRLPEGLHLVSVSEVGYCSTCHVIDTFCKNCHGMDMPHSTEFKEKSHPELVKTAPHTTRVGRLDEVTAARKPILRWKPGI